MYEASTTGVLLLDLQEELLRPIEGNCQVRKNIEKLAKALETFDMPVVVSAQEGSGEVDSRILKSLPEGRRSVHMRHAFSALQDSKLSELIFGMEQIETWIVVGVEAHIGIWQTALDLTLGEKEVIVLNDCIASRSIYDYSTAIAELRDIGVRISSVEMLLFELLGTREAPQYESVIALTKPAVI